MVCRILGITTFFVLSIQLTVKAQDWHPAEGPLKTRWAADVSVDCPWPEYPRPQMVRSSWVNLNGLWDYAIRPQSEPQPQEWDGKILVPFPLESALSGVMKPLRPNQRLWYHRTFEAPEIGEGRLLLHFGAVDWHTTIWLNGKQVGEHRGGYDPFQFDITPLLVDGQNELVVSVWDPTDSGWQPRGKQVLNPGGIMYTAVSGIWQTVWLEPVPANFIRSLKVVPDIDRGVVTVTIDAQRAAEVRLVARSGQSDPVNAEGPSGQPIELALAGSSPPKLWTPDDPHLYDLEVSLVQDGTVVDEVDSYFGMRKIEVRKDDQGINRLFLNNEPLFQYGPLDQGWWPDGLYLPATDEALQYDILMTKKFGMNLARKHVKYEPARWYFWCDRLGLLVWQDMPAGGSERNDESKENFRRELKAMIDTLHNYPCIVMWIPFNEGWGQHDTTEIVRWIEQYDPTRPVNEASGWTDRQSGTISDMHSYPGPGMRPVEEDRAVVLGEFGGLGMPVRGHCWQDERNWGYVSFQNPEELTEAYVGLLTAMRPLIGKGLSAAVYTQTSDVEIEVNGLMTYDREVVKMDLDRIAAAAKKLYGPPPILIPVVPTSRQRAQQWHYTTEPPAENWFEPQFDAQSWKTGPGGFGTEGTPGSVVGTPWRSSDLWIRRTFSVGSVPSIGQLCLEIHHDEDAEVYLNGQLIKKLSGYTTNYVPVPLDESAVNLLREGSNTIAVHCHQSQGGQFIDVGLVLQIEPDKP